INSIADYQSAISASQSVPYNFFLNANLTFSDGSHSFFLSTGATDNQYLKINNGCSFNGQGNTLTFSSGCEPSGGVQGVFVCTNSGHVISNIQFIVNSGVSMANSRSFLLRQFGDKVTFQNIIFLSYIQPSSQGTFFGYSDTNRKYERFTFENVYVNCYASITNNYACVFTGGSDYTTYGVLNLQITNCAVIYSGGHSDTNTFGFVILGNGQSGGTSNSITINGLYVYENTILSTNPNYKSVIGFLLVPNSTTLQIRECYCIMGAYSSVPTSSAYFTFVQNAGSVTFDISGTQLYINTYNATNGGSWPPSLSTPGVQLQFTGWVANTTPPPSVFSNFTTSTVPYLLTSFQSSPFDSTSYTNYISTAPQFSYNIPCICEGSEILTIHGYKTVEELQEGDYILTPCQRTVPIMRIYKETVKGNKDNSPYYIPSDCFYPEVPNKGIFISANHAVFGQEKWIIPCQYGEKIKQCKDYYGKDFVYYHIQLPNFACSSFSVLIIFK
ncbi:hypothetical protein EBU95_20240, partial [bacterium]|nr:hypothetical protein [bacterium]